MIELEHLTKTFGEKVAVRDLNLRVKEGELFAFLGPNGAGKTTTIKLIVGLLKPTSGRVRIAGIDINEDPIPAKRLIGYVSDQPFLYEKLTGREFLHFVAELYQVENASERIESLVETFGMHDYIDRLSEDYSHGMKQKVVFSSAFLHEPKLIVVDEPTVGLDPASIKLLKELLGQKVREGVTAFVSTHTLSFAEDTAERIGIISNGRLIAVGTLEELRERAGREERLEDIFLELTQSDTESA